VSVYVFTSDAIMTSCFAPRSHLLERVLL